MMMSLTANEAMELIAIEELERFKSGDRSLLGFTNYTFEKYQANWHHHVICDHVDKLIDGRIDRLMLLMPPRNGKSELISRRLPAYAFGRNPDEQIISCSYNSDLASSMNRDVQRIMDDPKYGALFPNTRLSGQITTSKKSNQDWLRNSDLFEIVERKGYYRCAGVGGGITGRGATLALIDDPIKNRLEAESETYRKRLWEWYTSTFLTRLEKNARLCVTLTRWHEDDLAGRILKNAAANNEKWIVLKFPAIKGEEDLVGDPRQVGEALWPWKYPIERLNRIHGNIGSREFNSLYQQEPFSEGGEIIKRHWWRWYNVIPNRFDEVLGSLDCSFKGLDSSDYVVFQVWGRIKADKYLLDQARAKLGFTDTVKMCKTMIEKWPKMRTKLVEDKANGSAVIDTLKKSISGMTEFHPEGSKQSRAFAISPQVESGNVYLPSVHIAPWIENYVNEWSKFPNGKHDDQVDATTQALIRLASNERTAFRNLAEWD